RLSMMSFFTLSMIPVVLIRRPLKRLSAPTSFALYAERISPMRTSTACSCGLASAGCESAVAAAWLDAVALGVFGLWAKSTMTQNASHTNETARATVEWPVRSVNHEKISGKRKIPMPSKIPTDRLLDATGLPQCGHVGAASEISFLHSGQLIMAILWLLLCCGFLQRAIWRR